MNLKKMMGQLRGGGSGATPPPPTATPQPTAKPTPKAGTNRNIYIGAIAVLLCFLFIVRFSGWWLLVVTILGAITVTLPFLLSRKIVVSPTGEIEEHKKETGSAPGAAVVFFLGLFLSLAIGIVLGNSLEKFLCPILNEVWYKYVG
jgi:hypothetical protein